MRRDGLRWCDSGELRGLYEKDIGVANCFLLTCNHQENSADHTSSSSSPSWHVPRSISTVSIFHFTLAPKATRRPVE